MEAFKRLKKDTIIVYVDSKKKDGMEYLSPVIVGGLQADSMGNTIPKLVVASPDQTQLFAAMSYKQTKDAKQFKKVVDLVKNALKGDVKGGPKDAILRWPLKMDSRFYTGNFVSLDKEKQAIVVKNEKGKTLRLPLAKLSAGSQAYAKMMAAGGADAGKPKVPAGGYPLEPWESAKGGKTVHARFVSLRDGKITLKRSDGKLLTFSLTILSDKSQQQAKKWTGEE